MPTSTPQRFEATIFKQGPNPYVDVPENVSEALAEHGQAGRISVEGELNGASIQTTLVPWGDKRHRLYVNGGMRSAARVGVGDTVSFELRATAPDAVRPPDDVAAALRKIDGARSAFDALEPSHRRELIRYINNAKTAETRERRVRKTVDHVVGKEVGPDRGKLDRPLWTCPRCGNEFVNKNQYHSCARHTLAELFAGKPPHIRELFDRFRDMVEAWGPAKVIAYHDRAGFMLRVRFAAAVPKTRWLDVGLWLPRRVDNPRFHRIETLTPNTHVHLLRVTDTEQLDDQVAEWVKEAYAVGRQEHLK